MVLLVVVKLSLLKVENVENITILELLFIEVCDAVSCLFTLSLLFDVDVTCALKIWLDGAWQATVLYRRLDSFWPLSENVRQCYIDDELQWRNAAPIMPSLKYRFKFSSS
jgi:hypothetical protein